MDSPDFVRDFGVVIVAAAVSFVVFRHIKLPPVLGFLLVGALLGPFSFAGSLVRDVETIRLLADVGLVMLLFALGVELGWERIRRVGVGVLLIAGVEVAAMIGLGYAVGRLMGWSPVDALFLGAAISISSSAVLVQMLRDRGELVTARGQLVVGILVVEDFVAVILLSVLAGISSGNGEAQPGAWPVIWRLLAFAVAALVLGGLLAPRLLDLLARMRSNQGVLMGALGMCFGLAIIAGELGLSAAAGAFLIGTVVGDTKHSRAIARMTEPVRDLFAALFFVSIGMLVNFADIGRYIGPVLLVTGVVIAGKLVFNTIATYATGRSGREALDVGTAMPQPGEFSLAIVKVGTDHGSVGAALNPVVTAVIALSSLVYPVIFGSAAWLERHIRTRSPSVVQRHAGAFNASASMVGQIAYAGGEPGRQIRQAAGMAAINLAMIAMLIVLGVVALNFAGLIGASLGVSTGLAGVALAGVAITLSVPPGMVVWKMLTRMADIVTSRLLLRPLDLRNDSLAGAFASLAQRVFFAGALFLVAVWATPMVLELVAGDDVSTPVSVLIMVATVAATARIAMRVHSLLETRFSHTFMGTGTTQGAGSPLSVTLSVRDEEAVVTQPQTGSVERVHVPDFVLRRAGLLPRPEDTWISPPGDTGEKS